MLRRRPLLVALVVVLAGLLAPAAAHAAPRIIGGPVISDIRQAPFVVAVRTPDGACTGSLLDASRVLTAAHCTYAHESTQAYGPGDMTVVAKTATVPPLALSDGAEQHAVSSIDVHPYYVQRPGQIAPNDLAVLTLAAPVSLDDRAKPIAIGTGDGPLAPGRVAAIYGFGTATNDPGPADGRLRVQLTGIAGDDVCGNDPATIVCTQTPTASTCPGDSGGPLVVPGGTLAAVVAGSRNAGCVAGNPGTNTDLSAGENGQWVAGNATPPRAPRYASGATYGGYVDVGQVLSCRPGTWSGDGVAFTYTWTDAATGEVVQSGPSGDRALVASDGGRQLACTIGASGPGGSATLALGAQRIVPRAAAATPVPGGAPGGVVKPTVRLSAPRTVRRGKRTSITVRVTAGASAFAGGRICARLTGRATSKANRRSTCRRLSGPAAGGTVSLRLRVTPAKRGGVRVLITARLAGGVTATGSITRRVR